MAVQFFSQGGIKNPVRHKTMRGSNGLAPIGPMSYAVIAGGGGSQSGRGGAGGFRKSFGTELSGGGAPSENSLFFQASVNTQVTVGAGASSNTANGSNSVLGPITSLGGGFGGSTRQTGATGGSGGGGGGGFCPGDPGGGGGAGTAGQGFSGSGGGSGGLNGPYCAVGAGGSGGGAGGPGGVGLATFIRGQSQTFAVGSTNASAPNSGNSGQSGIVIVRYPSIYTISVGPGLTASTTTVESDKVTTFTAGTGNVSWFY